MPLIKLSYPEFWQKLNFKTIIFFPLSVVFLILSFLRYIFTRPRKIAKFVICIGNATVGGTGKTQLVKEITDYLIKRKQKYLIISKGYGVKLRKAVLVHVDDHASKVGDEAKELLNYGPVISTNKIEKAVFLTKDFNPDVLIVDDGYQNPAFLKDLNILTIDSDRLFGNKMLIPAGPMREMASFAIERADIIIAIGNKLISNNSFKKKIISYNKPFYQSLINLKTDFDLNKKYIAFCTIGNPKKFFTLLKKNGLVLHAEFAFPDHYCLTPKERMKLVTMANEYDCKLVTTAKDRVKLPENFEVITAEISLDFGNRRKELYEILDEKIFKKN